MSHPTNRQPFKFLYLTILVSCLRERAIGNKHGDSEYQVKLNTGEKPVHASVTDGISKPLMSARSLLKSETMSASKCIGEIKNKDVSSAHPLVLQ